MADVGAALKKGDLKFQLDGYKLKGSWVLVRTRGGPGGGPQQLAADQASRRVGGTCRHDRASRRLSVKSGGDFADILSQNHPEIRVSNRPARGGQAGEMFEKIVARALAMRDTRGHTDAPVETAEKPKAKTAARKRATASAPRTAKEPKATTPAKKRPAPSARKTVKKPAAKKTATTRGKKTARG